MKGYIYTLEVVLSVALLAAATAYLFGNVAEKPELQASILKDRSYEALEYLDSAGVLKPGVANNSEAAIEEGLRNVMPAGFDFEVAICTLACDSTNVPSNRSVVSVDYYTSTHREYYMGKKVKMWAWQAG